jgi:hypothetical protein
MALGGLVALALGGAAAGFGVVLLGSALIVLLLNVLFRVSIASNREREVEEQARDYYARHGRWPDDAPNPPTG